MFRRKKKEIKKPSAIELMAEASFPILPFLFNGSIVYCKVRCLNRTQLRAIGEFNLIDIRRPEDKKEYSLGEMIDVVNWQETLIKETLIEPTFAEIQERVYGKDKKVEDFKERLAEIRELVKDTDAEHRKEFEKEANAIELYIGSLLPTDFMDAITVWATGSDRSDIKKINREMLLEAAVLANSGKDNPVDHMEGDFTATHKEEINKSAWMVYIQYQEQKKIEKDNTGFRKIIRGGPVKNGR